MSLFIYKITRIENWLTRNLTFLPLPPLWQTPSFELLSQASLVWIHFQSPTGTSRTTVTVRWTVTSSGNVRPTPPWLKTRCLRREFSVSLLLLENIVFSPLFWFQTKSFNMTHPNKFSTKCLKYLYFQFVNYWVQTICIKLFRRVCQLCLVQYIC